MAEKTITAPLAIIKIGGNTVGKMKNITITENYQRGDVRGIGTFQSQEKPLLGVTCSFTAGAFFIDKKKFGNATNAFIPDVTGGGVDAATSLTNAFLLSDFPVTIEMQKVVEDGTFATGTLVTKTKAETILVIPDAMIESQSIDITEGAISGQNISGSYMTPVFLYK